MSKSLLTLLQSTLDLKTSFLHPSLRSETERVLPHFGDRD